MGAIVPIMGTMNSDLNVADALFSSTKQRLLALIFGQPERSFYSRELISLTGSGSGATQRELARLAQSGLLTITRIGNQKHYQANARAPIFHELCSIVIKSFGVADKIRQALQSLASPIACAFIYGSFAKGEFHAGSDIDIMIVSDALTLRDIFAVMQPIELQLGRKINPTLYTIDEFSQRRKTKNSFLTKVLAGTIILLIGDLNVGS
jgi:predicted nucleotidyltransferase